MKYLVTRGGKLYFRRRVPGHLVDLVGKREFKKSLGLVTGQESRAAAKIDLLARDTDRILEEAERAAGASSGKLELADQAYDWARREDFLKDGAGKTGGPYEVSSYEIWLDERLRAALDRSGKRHEDELGPEDFNPATWAKIQTAKKGDRLKVAASVRDAARSYAKRHKGGELPKAEGAAIEQFIEHAGDLLLKDIRRADVRDWINYLIKTRQQSTGTVRRRLNSIKAVVNRAIEDFELDVKNPFEKQKLPKAPIDDVSKRLPFNTAHWNKLEAYIRRKPPGDETGTVLRLLAHSPCRPLEIGGLNWSDVYLDHEVPHLMLRPNEWRELKTWSSARDVPLTDAARKALKAYWERQGSPVDGAVFGEACRDTSALSARINKAIRLAGIPKSERLVSYSFRHSFEEAMR
ncbi:MAG: DUF6538 domain-containing protein, partial [Henriciella sp.]|uniref:DUF6538 domain-containing protein n=1 Tax=Henriciella sp. TaxID=1968823 RepID=UPI003C76727B